MKKGIVFFCLAAVVLLASCGHSVSRVDATKQIDLSGYWNDTDLRLASDQLIKACLAAPRLTTFKNTNGRLPVIIVGRFQMPVMSILILQFCPSAWKPRSLTAAKLNLSRPGISVTLSARNGWISSRVIPTTPAWPDWAVK